MPVSIDLLNNEDGKCHIRARERILISPVRPIVNDPQLDVLHVLHKKTGALKKNTFCEIKVNKNFFMGGEMAYLWVRIDNTEANHACSLIIKQKHKLKINHKDAKCSK